LICSWGAQHADAAEIAQDSFAEAFLRREACRGDWDDPDFFGRWLRGIAWNMFRNDLRNRKRREKRLDSLTLTAVATAASETSQIDDTRLERLRAAIDQLPANLKQVVMMHYLDEALVSDVAALLSLPSKTVEGRLFQARKALKRIMESQQPLGSRGPSCHEQQ
jgi:RNA polymerase sigma-70 factor (ECF subfamily)